MPDLAKWEAMLQSDQAKIRLRAARALLERDDTPLPLLLHILDRYSRKGLGAACRLRLLALDHETLLEPMLERLSAPEPFVQCLACKVVGQSGNHAFTDRLLQKLDEPNVRVRYAAGYALRELGDPSALPEIRHRLAAGEESSSVAVALEAARRTLEQLN